MQGRRLRRILWIAGLLLSTSAGLDIALSITINYYVPSWTIGTLSLGCAIFIILLAGELK